MERLTERFENGQVGVAGCGKNCKHDHKFCENAREDCPTFEDIYEKLATYEDAEEQGRLVILPCKVGDTVYNTTWWDDIQEKVKVAGKTYYRTVRKYKVSKSTFGYSDIEEFGKTVFLTKSEAEAKLKELRGGENER